MQLRPVELSSHLQLQFKSALYLSLLGSAGNGSKCLISCIQRQDFYNFLWHPGTWEWTLGIKGCFPRKCTSLVKGIMYSSKILPAVNELQHCTGICWISNFQSLGQASLIHFLQQVFSSRNDEFLHVFTMVNHQPPTSTESPMYSGFTL